MLDLQSLRPGDLTATARDHNILSTGWPGCAKETVQLLIVAQPRTPAGFASGSFGPTTAGSGRLSNGRQVERVTLMMQHVQLNACRLREREAQDYLHSARNGHLCSYVATSWSIFGSKPSGRCSNRFQSRQICR